MNKRQEERGKLLVVVDVNKLVGLCHCILEAVWAEYKEVACRHHFHQRDVMHCKDGQVRGSTSIPGLGICKLVVKVFILLAPMIPEVHKGIQIYASGRVCCSSAAEARPCGPVAATVLALLAVLSARVRACILHICDEAARGTVQLQGAGYLRLHHRSREEKEPPKRNHVYKFNLPKCIKYHIMESNDPESKVDPSCCHPCSLHSRGSP